MEFTKIIDWSKSTGIDLDATMEQVRTKILGEIHNFPSGCHQFSMATNVKNDTFLMVYHNIYPGYYDFDGTDTLDEIGNKLGIIFRCYPPQGDTLLDYYLQKLKK